MASGVTEVAAATRVEGPGAATAKPAGEGMDLAVPDLAAGLSAGLAVERVAMVVDSVPVGEVDSVPAAAPAVGVDEATAVAVAAATAAETEAANTQRNRRP